MKSLSVRRREGEAAIYPAIVIMEPCPECRAKAGDKCLETWGGATFPRATPHRTRIEESKPKLGRT